MRVPVVELDTAKVLAALSTLCVDDVPDPLVSWPSQKRGALSNICFVSKMVNGFAERSRPNASTCPVFA